MTTDVQTDLSAHPFTDGLNPSHLQLLARLATERTYEAGEWIMRVDETADHLFLVRSGRAAIEIATPGRDPLIVSTVGSGGIVGWSWLLPPHRVHFDVVALDRTETIAIDAAGLRRACEADHELGYRVALRLSLVLASRLEATRLQLMDVYGTPR